MTIGSDRGRRSPPRGGVLAWALAGALAAFTLAAMLSIGVFLILPAAAVIVIVAKRFGTAGLAAGLPLGVAVIVAVLAVGIVVSSSPSEGSGSVGPS